MRPVDIVTAESFTRHGDEGATTWTTATTAALRRLGEPTYAEDRRVRSELL